MRLLLVTLLFGCAGNLHFADRKILWNDHDDAPVPKPPKRTDAQINWEGLRDAFFRPSQRFAAVDYLKEAENVNALDEVPDSTWFVNRRRDPSSPDDQPRWLQYPPEVVERGAAVDDGPVLPLVVLKEKTDGSSMGVVATDATGVKYSLKFDPAGYQGLVSSIEVVVTRLAWAAGWNVPGETMIEFRREDLTISPEATTVDRFDRRRPFTAEALDELVGHVAKNGVVRAAASRWIEGDGLGWFSFMGKDKHDKNDRVPHQQRRDLRGFGVWCAWVNNIDTFENNTFDTYVGDPGQGHVVHFQQGVGASFGRFAGHPIEYWMGREPYFNPGSVFLNMASLGMWPRPWQDVQLQRAHAEAAIEWPQFGFFDAEHFDPRHWRPLADNPAFVRQTARDRYWGAKQIVAFNQEEIRAAIRAGQLEPVAAEHLFQVLWARRERIARAFFSDVSPLDHFQLSDGGLCFEDLWLSAGLGGEAGTRYQARVGRAPLPVQGRCAALPPSDGYHIVELRAQRPGQKRAGPVVKVHVVARDGARHILGIER